MPIDWTQINLDTYRDMVRNPLYNLKVASVMLKIGEAIAAETLPPAPTPEEIDAYAKRQKVAARFFENPDHFVPQVALRLAIQPAVVALRTQLTTPWESLSDQDKAAVGSTLYAALESQMAYFAARIS